VTPGAWTYRRDAAGSRADFAAQGGGAGASLTCEADRRVRLRLAGRPATSVTVRASAASRTLALAAAAAPGAGAVAELAATDPLLDAMAFSRGRFAIEQAGQPPLSLPAWAEVGRVIEDCRP